MSAYPFTFEIRNAALGSVWRVRDVAGVVGFDPLELAGELVAWIEAGDGKQQRAARLEAVRLIGRHPAGRPRQTGRPCTTRSGLPSRTPPSRRAREAGAIRRRSDTARGVHPRRSEARPGVPRARLNLNKGERATNADDAEHHHCRTHARSTGSRER